MNRIKTALRSLALWFVCALLLGVLANQASAQIHTGYFKSDDGGAYYIRQIGNQVYWLGENPNGLYANILVGTVSGNKITARFWDVPKGRTQGMGELTLEIREGGSALVKVSSSTPFGSRNWHLAVPRIEIRNGIRGRVDYPPTARSRPAGFLGGDNNLTAVWMGNDYAYYYVRELPNGDVVWFAEHSLYGDPGGAEQPAFAHVFIGKRQGQSISGQWVDIPKGATTGSGTLTVSIQSPQDLQATAKTGGFMAGEWWRSLPGNLRGFADLHAHPMVNLGFGGKLVHGGADVGSLLPIDADCRHKVRAQSIAQALGKDNGTHGGTAWFGAENPCGDNLRQAVIDAFQEANKAVVTPDNAVGYPSFKDYPKWNDITHQKMWVDWIRRSYDAGQRVMIALAVNNFTIASGVAGPGDGPTDDKASADLQVAEIKAFVKRHDDFMEVAYTPADLRRIIAANKMAVVLGIEIDNIGNFIRDYANRTVPDAVVAAELDRLYNTGVRYIFPIHVIDNPFGGTAVYQDIFNLSNYQVSGKYWNLACSTPEEEIAYRFNAGGFDAGLAATKLFKGFNLDIFRNPKASPNCNRTGHKNALGLTPSGVKAIKEMMKRGMLIDIDHMSQAAANATLDLAEQVFNKYPLVSGHNSLRSMWPIDKARSNAPLRQIVSPNENARTEEQLQRLGKLGGMFGLGSDDVRADDFLKRYIAASQLIGRGRVAFGTDLNGLVKGPPPASGANIYSTIFPMSKTGEKSWDYRREGVAHYGMLADFLRDMSLKQPNGEYIRGNILKNAEYFAQMWEKAVSSGKGVNP